MSYDNGNYARNEGNYPTQSSFRGNSQDAPLTVGECLVMLLLYSIPVVNVVAVLYWALSSSVNRNKKSLAQALIVWGLIGILLVVLLFYMAAPMFREAYYYWDI